MEAEKLVMQAMNHMVQPFEFLPHWLTVELEVLLLVPLCLLQLLILVLMIKDAKLQAPSYGILPPTTAIIGSAIVSEYYDRVLESQAFTCQTWCAQKC